MKVKEWIKNIPESIIDRCVIGNNRQVRIDWNNVLLYDTKYLEKEYKDIWSKIIILNDIISSNKSFTVFRNETCMKMTCYWCPFFYKNAPNINDNINDCTEIFLDIQRSIKAELFNLI